MALYGIEWAARRFRETFFNNPGDRFLSTGIEFNIKPHHAVEDIFPLTEVTFEGCRFFAPGKYDVYLRRKYGDYLALPPVERRTSHHARRIVVDITQGV